MGKVVVILGPTATGKTALALKLCQKFNGEIISVDSRQAYKGMEIGTGKATIDNGQLTINKVGVRIHLYDVAAPDQRLNAFDYSLKAWEKMEQIWSRKKVPFLTGGTGFYLDVILGRRKLSGVSVDQNLRNRLELLSKDDLVEKLRQSDPNKLVTIDLKNKYRLIRALEVAMGIKNSELRIKKFEKPAGYHSLLIGLAAENEFLYQRADGRVDLMVKAGLVEEVKGLVEKYGWPAPGLQTLGYRELKPYLEGTMQLDPSYAGLQSKELSKRFRGVYARTNESLKGINIAVEKIKFNTHAYIRRQKTYFKKYYADASWFDVGQTGFEERVVSRVESFLGRQS